MQYKGGSELRCSLWKKCCGCDMSFKFVEKNVLDARNNIDKDVKNKQMWNWLLEADVNRGYFVRLCEKISQPGVAICVWLKETFS